MFFTNLQSLTLRDVKISKQCCDNPHDQLTSLRKLSLTKVSIIQFHPSRKNYFKAISPAQVQNWLFDDLEPRPLDHCEMNDIEEKILDLPPFMLCPKTLRLSDSRNFYNVSELGLIALSLQGHQTATLSINKLAMPGRSRVSAHLSEIASGFGLSISLLESKNKKVLTFKKIDTDYDFCDGPSVLTVVVTAKPGDYIFNQDDKQSSS